MFFSIGASKISIKGVLGVFIEIKIVRYFLVKVILAFLVLLFLNYRRYIYYRVGLRIKYGVVFVYAFLLVLIVWVL